MEKGQHYFLMPLKQEIVSFCFQARLNFPKYTEPILTEEGEL